MATRAVVFARPRASPARLAKEKRKSTGERVGVDTPLKGGIYLPPSPSGPADRKPLTKEQILNLLYELDAKTRKEILAHLALSEQTSGRGDGRDIDMWATAVYEGLAASVGSGAMAGQGPALVKRTLAAAAVWAPVEAFMKSAKFNELTVTKRAAVYHFLAKLVVSNARTISRKSGAPTSAKLVGSCAANIASIFDTAFPGYLEAGLAYIVATQLVKGSDD